MEESRSALIDAALAAQATITKFMLATSKMDWLTIDVSLTQLKCLVVLLDVEALPGHQLATALHLSRPATSMLVDHLVRAELVGRNDDPLDRRRTLVRLTDRGRAYISRLRLGQEGRWRELLSQLDAADLAALAQGVQALATIARNARAAGG